MVSPSLLVKFLAISSLTIEKQNNHDKVASRNAWDSNYDFIVVGAGAAGSVVAARLSENPKVKILLIEAGGPENAITDIPTFTLASSYQTSLWSYKTVPQNYLCGQFENNQCSIIQGKYLGGSSAVNGMAYYRGLQSDYDNWEKVYGAKGWSFKDVLPYYIGSENQTNKEVLAKRDAFHGVRGPLTVSTISGEPAEFFSNVVKAHKNLSYEYDIDINTSTYNKKFGYYQQTIKDGHRLSTSAAFLEPNIQRPNLHILAYTTATKVLFNNQNKTSGVEFYRDGKFYQVNASKAVIISCNAINSAKLLLLSGVGPKSHLKSLGIEMIADLPVGDNFIASPEFGNIGLPASTSAPESYLNIENLYEYYINGTGPLTNFGGLFTYIKTKYSESIPDIALITSIRGGFQYVLNAWLLRPESRGTIRLNSTNPFDSPIVNPNYFSKEIDKSVYHDGLREVFKIARKIREYGLQLVVYGDCKPCTGSNATFDTPCEQYLSCLTKNYARDGLHLAGTCRMGSEHDEQAVVNERLKVRKVDGLHVCDSSIMPQITSQGTYTPTVMIGERCAKFIKDDYNV